MDDMNDKQDRPYVCSAPGCSQVSWLQSVYIYCDGVNSGFIIYGTICSYMNSLAVPGIETHSQYFICHPSMCIKTQK